MIVKAETVAKLRIEKIEGKGPFKYVIISGRMGEAEPEFTQSLRVGDDMIAHLKIDIDTDKEAKWDKLFVSNE